MTTINLVLLVVWLSLITINGFLDLRHLKSLDKSMESTWEMFQQHSKYMSICAENINHLQVQVANVQKSEKDNALTIRATLARIDALQRIEADDVKRLTDDITVIADMMAQMKFTSYRPNSHFRADMGRILELASRLR